MQYCRMESSPNEALCNAGKIEVTKASYSIACSSYELHILKFFTTLQNAITFETT